MTVSTARASDRSTQRARSRPWQAFTCHGPVAELLRSTARREWRLIGVSLVSNLVEAFSEGATLAVVFLALDVLSATATIPYDWATKPLVGRIPALVNWLNGLPSVTVFVNLLAVAVLLQALQSLTRFVNLVSVGYFTARCKTLMTEQIHSQVLRLSFTCASGFRVGDLTDYVSLAPLAMRIQIEQTSQLFVALLLVATYLAVLVGISPWLLLAVALMAGVIALLQKRLMPLIRSGSKQIAEAQSVINSLITEHFQALRLLHSLGQLNAAVQQVRLQLRQDEQLLRAQARRLAVLTPFASFLPILAISIIAILSLVLFGGRSTGVLPSLVTFVLAIQRLNQRLSMAANCINQVEDNQGRIWRLNQILSPVGKSFLKNGGVPFASMEHEIRFENVSLRYSPELPPALNRISFSLPKGSMLALVGPSGAGKSSVADILCGLYMPSAGKIWIDNISLQEIDLASWQQRLGVVSQDTFLFNASIADNIAFGTPGVSQFQIEAACEAAQASSFIESLPQGYNTLVGERGYRLSGGQRQRLSLARAILREPELLILDEATSALDSESERLVQEAIDRFEQNHTVLVIAHRLSTVVGADQILVLEGGMIAERGNHDSLYLSGGLYHSLWRQQTDAGQILGMHH